MDFRLFSSDGNGLKVFTEEEEECEECERSKSTLKRRRREEEEAAMEVTSGRWCRPWLNSVFTDMKSGK